MKVIFIIYTVNLVQISVITDDYQLFTSTYCNWFITLLEIFLIIADIYHWVQILPIAYIVSWYRCSLIKSSELKAYCNGPWWIRRKGAENLSIILATIHLYKLMESVDSRWKGSSLNDYSFSLIIINKYVKFEDIVVSKLSFDDLLQNKGVTINNYDIFSSTKGNISILEIGQRQRLMNAKLSYLRVIKSA